MPSTTLTPPATIKVARRFPANDPSGVIVGVDTVDFRTYCVRVLSHEWAPPSAFSDEALHAGALAVKDYAWYWATHPTKLPDVAAWAPTSTTRPTTRSTWAGTTASATGTP